MGEGPCVLEDGLHHRLLLRELLEGNALDVLERLLRTATCALLAADGDQQWASAAAMPQVRTRRLARGGDSLPKLEPCSRAVWCMHLAPTRAALQWSCLLHAGRPGCAQGAHRRAHADARGRNKFCRAAAAPG
jgi:hypothetical protein